MEPVLLGLAAPSAINEAGNLLERSLRAAAEPFAAVLHAVASTLDPETDVSSSGSVGILDLESHFQVLTTILANRIEQALTSAGIELEQPVALHVSEFDGGIEVMGEHPQKALIESSLADDETLAAQFTEMIAIGQLLATGDREDGAAAAVVLGEAAQEPALAIFSIDDTGPKLDVNCCKDCKPTA